MIFKDQLIDFSADTQSTQSKMIPGRQTPICQNLGMLVLPASVVMSGVATLASSSPTTDWVNCAGTKRVSCSFGGDALKAALKNGRCDNALLLLDAGAPLSVSEGRALLRGPGKYFDEHARMMF